MLEEGSCFPTTPNRKQITNGLNMEVAVPLLLHPFHPKTIPTIPRNSSQNNKHTKGKINTWMQDGVTKLNLHARSYQLQITPKCCKKLSLNCIFTNSVTWEFSASRNEPAVMQHWGWQNPPRNSNWNIISSFLPKVWNISLVLSNAVIHRAVHANISLQPWSST